MNLNKIHVDAFRKYDIVFCTDGEVESDSEVTILTSNVPRFISWPVRTQKITNILGYFFLENCYFIDCIMACDPATDHNLSLEYFTKYKKKTSSNDFQ